MGGTDTKFKVKIQQPLKDMRQMYCGVCGELCKKQRRRWGVRQQKRWGLCCRKDVICAERDADRKGERQYLEDQKKDLVTFKAFMDNYRKECPTRGIGKKRKDFDWTQQKKLTLKTSRTGDGFEGEMVDMEEYIT